MAKLFALRSVTLGFPIVDNFLEKGEIYLAVVRVLHSTRNIELIRRIERPMLIIIRTKTAWNDADEMAMVANVYLTMYQTRYAFQSLEVCIAWRNCCSFNSHFIDKIFE